MGCQESSIARVAYKINQKSIIKASRLNRKLKELKAEDQYNTFVLPNHLKKSNFNLQEDDIEIVKDLLLNHQLLYKFKGRITKEIMNRLEKIQVKQNDFIFSKGDIADYFYIIIQGSVSINGMISNEEYEKVLQRGESFGDMAIYNKTLRSANAKALENCKLLGLRKDHFLRVTMELSKSSHQEVFNEIKHVSIFQHLNLNEKHRISYLAQEIKYTKNDFIFKKGQASNCLYVVKSGKVCLDVPNKEKIEVKARQTFGEGCLHDGAMVRFADACCLQNTILYAFSRADIKKYIGSLLMQVQNVNKLIWALKHDKKLQLSQIVIDVMINEKSIQYCQDEQLILSRGEEIKHFIISLNGSINDYPELQILNTDYLINMKFSTETLKKKGKGAVAFISIEAIQDHFNRKFINLVNLDTGKIRQIQSFKKLKKYVKTLELSSYKVTEIKGTGQYGPTLKVKSQSNIQFVLKVINKSVVLQQGSQNQILMLKKVNNKLTHSFISKNYRIYSDESRVYFLNRLIQGQDLFQVLSKEGKFNINTVKHFLACVINIMEYLHSRRIVWRQMKVQSFVVDRDGYLNLVDLMYLQEIPEEIEVLETMSKATFYYLPPEALSGQGYGFQSDFWTLGILIYKLTIGEYPYGQKINFQDPNALHMLLDQIINKDIYYPKWFPIDLKILIKLLLNPQPLERGLIKFSKLKSMTIFRDYDWLGLMQKKLKTVPYLPKKNQKKSGNEINFDDWLENQKEQPHIDSILKKIDEDTQN